MGLNKKAQGLSLNMVVIGAISVVVLVVIIAIFVSSMSHTKQKMEKVTSGYNCTQVGGVVMLPDECSKEGGTVLIGTFNDVNPPTQVCCKLPEESP